MNDRLTELVKQLEQGSWRDMDVDSWERETRWLELSDEDEVRTTIAALRSGLDGRTLDSEPDINRLQWLLQRLTAAVRRLAGESARPVFDSQTISHISFVYNQLQLEAELLAAQLLQLLGGVDELSAQDALLELLIRRPPTHPHAVALVMSALFRYDSDIQQRFFPRILDALEHLSVAAPVLDLANYLYREKRVRPHPAAERSMHLGALLGQLADRLDQIAEHPQAAADSPQELSRVVNDCVSLGVSLCDALALIGDRSVIGKIYRAFEVEHRRLQTEAAWALAKMEEPEGGERLIRLAAEPAVRLRVLHYADELDMLDQVDPRYRSQEARAEAALAAWLAEPTHFGLAPTRLELVDRREMYWPGYDEPQECFLFRFGYDFLDVPYSNIGIAGPLTHAFAVDLGNLPPDDIYAAFAGFSIQHESLRQVEASEATGPWAVTRDRLARRIEEQGYTDVEPRLVGDFFGEELLVATCRRGGVEGVAVADVPNVQWRAADVPRSLGPSECFSIYVGRKLLKAFNP